MQYAYYNFRDSERTVKCWTLFSSEVHSKEPVQLHYVIFTFPPTKGNLQAIKSATSSQKVYEQRLFPLYQGNSDLKELLTETKSPGGRQQVLPD